MRVLMRSVIRCGRYDPGEFIEDFIEHMTTPGRNRDPYSEIYIRRWFENYSRGFPPNGYAELQRNVWSIGSHGGVIRPLVVSTIAQSAYQGLGLASEHQNLTHRSEPEDRQRIFGNLPLGLMGATPGNFGSAFSQYAWLPVLRVLGTQVWSGKLMWVSGAMSKFDQEGNLVDAGVMKQLSKYMNGFVYFVTRMKA